MRKSVITTLALVVFLAINYGNVQAKEIEIQQVDPLNCKLNMILAMLRFVFYLLSSILILYTIAKYNKVKKMEQKKKYDFVVKNILHLTRNRNRSPSISRSPRKTFLCIPRV